MHILQSYANLTRTAMKPQGCDSSLQHLQWHARSPTKTLIQPCQIHHSSVRSATSVMQRSDAA